MITTLEQICIGSTQTALTISGLSKIKIKVPNDRHYDTYIEKSKLIQTTIKSNNIELEKLYCLRTIVISQILKGRKM